MTDKVKVTPKKAAEQLQNLLSEKLEVEQQIDSITGALNILKSNKEKGRDPISKVYVESNLNLNQTNFKVDSSILAEVAQTMLDKHAKRLDEINDSLLFMVKIIK